MEKKVVILLSTYNGEKYIEKQLESLFNQSYWKYCTLFVRDDGSSDNTVQILERYESEKKLILERGSNCGFVKSFFWLLENAPQADYYSFCDQDDYWLDFKVERAVTKLEESKSNMYFSDFFFVDENLDNKKERITPNNNPTFYESLTDCRASGFTILIDNLLKEQFLKYDINSIFYHDHFVYMLSFLFGKKQPYYDRIPTALYRRHGNNESESSNEKIKLLMWRIKNFLFSKNTTYMDSYKNLLTYKDNLKYNELKILKLMSEKKSIKSQFKKVFFNHRFRKTLSEEIAFRLLCLLWRF